MKESFIDYAVDYFKSSDILLSTIILNKSSVEFMINLKNMGLRNADMDSFRTKVFTKFCDSFEVPQRYKEALYQNFPEKEHKLVIKNAIKFIIDEILPKENFEELTDIYSNIVSKGRDINSYGDWISYIEDGVYSLNSFCDDASLASVLVDKDMNRLHEGEICSYINDEGHCAYGFSYNDHVISAICYGEFTDPNDLKEISAVRIDTKNHNTEIWPIEDEKTRMMIHNCPKTEFKQKIREVVDSLYENPDLSLAVAVKQKIGHGMHM